MCGIFGVHGHGDAAHLAQLGLYSLQHRGQESAGVAVFDDEGGARVVRSMGTMSQTMASELEAFHGPMAVGHTRYSTAGSSTIENAQPVFVRTRGGYIALAHNGNLTNAGELRQELESTGSIFSSTMDSEVLVHRLAKSTAPTPDGRVAEALAGVEGAYSLIIGIGDTLIAARDPRGWRPLVMGRLNGSVVFASETCALDIVGAKYDREVKPGEVVAVDRAGVRSSFPLPPKPLTRCVFEYVYFARPDSRVFADGSVDRARRALGRRLAKEHPAVGADLVFAVPDSSNSAALGFAEESGLPYEFALIRNHYVGRTFIQPTQRDRDAKVKVKYNAVREVLNGKSVVMVDDSIVRGTTTRGLVSLVRAAGAREVHMRVSSPPITGPCYYGIDTPTREELIAANLDLAGIREHLGVDSLGYLSLEGMLQSVPDGPNGFCHACFSGDYPTPPPTDPDKLRFGCGC
ncbi:MAG TPA: amidophosphoribosyltransferase [Gemmatimonadaceae bacterium]|nr:amidophosphoribosyltransferase [Gemmatimonadaceae bacterium]